MINKKSITVLKALKNKDLNDTQIVALLGSASVAIPIIDNLLERKYIVKKAYKRYRLVSLFYTKSAG